MSDFGPHRSSLPSCSSTSTLLPSLRYACSAHRRLVPSDSSYVEDPKWQRKFSIIWAAGIAIAVLLSLPSVLLALRRGRLFRSWLVGVSEAPNKRNYAPAAGDINEDVAPKKAKRRVCGVLETVWSATYWSLPGIELDLGQMAVIAAYLALVVICITDERPPAQQSQPSWYVFGLRICPPATHILSGFMALAQFPVVFLFGTKNSILSLLLGPGHGYEKLNYIHRWAGRGIFIGATVHGALWINNHIVYGLPIIGQQKETSGVAAYGVLCGLILTSFRPVRRFFYQSFFIIHVLGYVAFFITICYHTIYASPWIFPPLAFYGFDMLLRMFRYRVKDATLVPVDNNMTLVRIIR
ncbi:hypothetical protein NUW54_g12455 [Trametes sanguinea]|uniref:Uncharacterized protein n=1 Tax=Trametes sanguinea TaxID=158606 RepID=A0ACC1MXB5_9APHY|nr:hypothetical protein NUW54_g12455 [Trametes sanguinea]